MRFGWLVGLAENFCTRCSMLEVYALCIVSLRNSGSICDICVLCCYSVAKCIPHVVFRDVIECVRYCSAWFVFWDMLRRVDFAAATDFAMILCRFFWLSKQKFRICFNSMLRCCFGYRIACGRAVLAAVIEMVQFHYSCGTRKGWVPSALRQISWQALFLVGMWPCSGLRKCCRGRVLRMCLPLQF